MEQHALIESNQYEIFISPLFEGSIETGWIFFLKKIKLTFLFLIASNIPKVYINGTQILERTILKHVFFLFFFFLFSCFSFSKFSEFFFLGKSCSIWKSSLI